MTTWTDSAKDELRNYLDHVRRRLDSSAGDPDEILEDLERHMHEELAASDTDVITGRRIRELVARIGMPEGARAEPVVPIRIKHLFFLLIFGVLLPTGTLILEVLTGICAMLLFDPIATPLHMLLVALVPCANLYVLWSLRQGRRRLPLTLAWINGLAGGVALFYALLFLPFTPFAAIGILYFGLGLVPLAPLFSTVCAFNLSRLLQDVFHGPTRKRIIKGRLAGFILLLCLEAPTIYTQIALHQAAGSHPATSRAGVRMLQFIRVDDQLLRRCYMRRGRSDITAFVLSMLYTPPNMATCQAIYYRVTGTPFNAVKPPPMKGFRGQVIDQDHFDFGQGGDAVAARVGDLYLQQSQMDGDVRADEGSAYLEWILEFKNGSKLQREARTRITLPPDSVVSRLSLWIDGEEREAAYSTRGKVKAAYKKVVIVQRRDPAMVTTCGPDQVLLQCFPVPPGGVMKVKLGVTAPLALTSLSTGRMRLPYMEERNFNIPADLRHEVWLESDHALSNATAGVNWIREERAAGCTLRGELSHDALNGPCTVEARRNPSVVGAHALDTHGNETITRTIHNLPIAQLERVVIVIDGSQRMKHFIPALRKALNRLPDGLEVAVLQARDDEVYTLCPLTVCGAEMRGDLLRALSQARFAGGCDNVPALREAWDLAAFGSRNPAILWLHAAQPLTLLKTEALRQRWHRRPGQPKLFDLPLETGPNVVAEKLYDLPAYSRVARYYDATTDITAWFQQHVAATHCLGYQSQSLIAERQTSLTNLVNGSSHVVRLWAYERIRAYLQALDNYSAERLAADHQLVTSVSGAVVLENETQYNEAGLVPAHVSTAPQIVPEPATAALLFVGLALLLIVKLRK